jgi:hypothetical protein
VEGGGLREIVKKEKFIVIASLESKVERTTRIYVRGIFGRGKRKAATQIPLRIRPTL